MKLKIKKLNKDAVLPRYMSEGAAGMDLTATSVEYNFNTDTYVYGTGLAMEIPEGYVGLLFPRSSIYKNGLSMTNCVGVIDSDYRGEVMAIFREANKYNAEAYHVGERICQLIVVRIPWVDIEEVDELTKTERGTGGHGSTGK